MKCCDLTSGMLRHVVDFQSQGKTSDGQGGNVLAWQTFAPGVRGFLKPLSGRERLQAGRLEANVTHLFYTRYRADIKAEHSLLYGTRRMQVRTVINVEEANKWLEISLEEGVTT